MSDKTKALISIGLFTFMSTLDGSIVNVALPTMSRELGATTTQITWVVTIYLITISALILVFGRLGDLVGKSRVSKVGWLIFIIGSFMAGLNFGWGLPWLLGSRVFQAVGSAMFMATSFGIVAQVYPPESRARALSVTSMFVSIGSIAGPGIGGLILSLSTWNYIFWINVPIGLVAYFFGSRALPKDETYGQASDVDKSGSLLMALSVVLLFLALNLGQSMGWLNPGIIIAVVVGILSLFLFIRTENKKSKPLIDFGIFKNKLFSLSLITALLNFTVAMFSSILLPFYLQDYHSFSPGMAGLVMMAYPVAMLISSPISGTIADRVDKELVTFIGITALVISQAMYLFVGARTEIWYVAMVLFIQGGSMGIFQSPNNALIMETVDRKYLGIAGSINSLARNVAFVLGTSVATIVLFLTMSSIVGKSVTTYLKNRPEAFLMGMHTAFYVAIGLVFITWVIALIRLRGRKHQQIS